MSQLERVLMWVIRVGIILLLFTPLVVSKSLFFPFITGKNFYFRIIVEIIFGVWCSLAILQPIFRPRKSPLLYTLIAFVGVLIFATIFGVDPYHSFWSNFERMEGLITYLHIFALFLVAAYGTMTTREWFIYFNISVGICFVTAIYGILQGVGVMVIVGEGRPFATFGNSIYLGVYLLFHLFIITILFSFVKNNWIRIAYGFIFICDVYAFFLAASRGAFIGLSAGVFIVALLMALLLGGRRYRVIAFILVVLLFFVAGAIRYFPESAFIRNNEVFSRLSSVRLENLRQDPRVLIWGMAWKAFQERPFLGWGPENFIIPYGKYYDANLFGNEAWFDRAHNMLLEWLVASGFLGFTAFLSIFIAALITLRSLVRERKLDMISAIFIIGFLVAYIVQDIFVFDNIVTYMIFTLVLAFLASFSSSMSTKFQGRHSSIMIIVAILPLIASVFIIYSANAKQILTARQLIVALESLSKKKGDVDGVIDEFDKAISYNTFGTTEVRERIADTAVQIAMNVDNLNEQYIKLLDKSIQEIEKEATYQPNVTKYPSFLGKLYSIRVNLSGSNSDKEKAILWYGKAQELAPHYVQTYLGFAELYLLIKDYDKAVTYAREAQSIPTKHNTLRVLFHPVLSVYVIGGKFDEATDFFGLYKEDHVRNLLGDSEETRLLIKRTFVSQNIKGRLRFLLKVDELSNNSYICLALAQTYIELGNEIKAREYAEKALTESPSLNDQVEQFLKSLDAFP